MSAPFWGETPPATRVSPDEAVALARDVFGVDGVAEPLGSNQETNLRVRGTDGSTYVLKVANPAFGADVLDLQNRAMRHVQRAGTGLAVPLPVPALDGSDLVSVPIRGIDHHVRLLTFVAGEMFSDADYLGADVLGRFGALTARLSAALATFDHPAADRVLQYDSRHAARVVDRLAGSVADPLRRADAVDLSDRAWSALTPLVPDLRVQVVHADMADYNVVATRDAAGRLTPSGVIDFGDVVRSWLVADLATAITSLLVRERRSPLLDACAVVVGFHSVTPLTEPEIAAVWPLVAARASVLATSVEDILAADPDNDYAREEQPLDWLILDRAAAVPFPLAEVALRQAVGLDAGATAARVAAWRPARPVVDVPADAPRIDLSVTTTLLPAATWTDPAATRTAIEAASADGYGVAGGGARLPSVLCDAAEESASVHLGIDAFAPSGSEVRAPADGSVSEVRDDGVVLRSGDVDVLLAGIRPSVAVGAPVAAGDVVGRVGAPTTTGPLPPHVHAQVTPAGLAARGPVEPSVATAWRALSPDASSLVGATAPDVPTESAEELIARRDAVVARVQEHYFAHPPRIERGWRHHLLDTSGMAYLDMVNNVAVVGHSHPRVTAAASRQLGLLNTNSRFSYDGMVTYAERIVELLPEPLDTVFFVNSGSEAVDLALRIVRSVTGRKDTICLAGGYHGWSTATDEISTTLNDNPHSRGTRPPWVHLAPMPNLFRGEHRGADAADRYADAVRSIVAQIPGGPAAFVAEPLSGNAGGVEIPPGYLPQVYESVRAAGGLVVSDEVQVGYGRTGGDFWGFQMHGVVPDVVTMAKAAGNGHPIGFVVTRREIAEQFSSQGSFFSSVGGSPVSSAVGVAVLDVLRDEGLQENAARIGAHLSTRLEALRERHSLIGCIHGRGLYQGVELVRDPETLEPATEEATAICERLRELGVIEHATGDYSNVLKVKPPLCITRDSADFFVDRLDEVLSAGW
ncbi:aminotransferase [Nocardioides guangzhouensis]|uniref:aminotransferase n=1 Tax=Nocardioides guangzhouensis TaxID=2497878 RepID=UPI0014382611|nr:aminotransferase [Nocardioides guangzhouensis]